MPFGKALCAFQRGNNHFNTKEDMNNLVHTNIKHIKEKIVQIKFTDKNFTKPGQLSVDL